MYQKFHTGRRQGKRAAQRYQCLLYQFLHVILYELSYATMSTNGAVVYRKERSIWLHTLIGY
jgi:hypothetical protein